MPDDFAIRVENVGKKYVINHQRSTSDRRYVALRDVLTNWATAPLKKIFSPQKNSTESTDQSQTKEDFWALRDVSFEIKKGEAVGVIGRNGAGKSTLLKVLSRITEPSTGSITINGRVASLLEVGTGFHPELTGRENIYLNGAILGMRRAEIKAKFDEIVSFSEVEKFIDTPVKRYSSGMYMRLAFGVAAHLEPEILVVDEVLAVGDAAFQQKCLGKMQDVGKSGRTVLFVSHNTEALARLCSSCIYLVNGTLQTSGPTREVIREYSDNFKQSAGEIDLTTLRRRFEGSGTGQLTRLRSLQTTATTAYWCYDYGSPIGFTIDFNIFKYIEEPEIGYAIFSMSGMELASSTTFQEKRIENLKPGQYQIKVIIPNLMLNPGKYILALGLSTMGKNIDNIGEAAQIEILPTDLSASKGLYKIWAPITPTTTFDIVHANQLPYLTHERMQ